MLDWLLGNPLPLGTPAPEFTALDQDGAPVSLSSLRGKYVVLVFYPKDETPVCRAQLCELRDIWSDLQTRGVTVLGVNPGAAKSHTEFRERHQFPFPLLVDEGSRIAKLYNAHGPVTRRTVYVIDSNGIICFAERGRPTPERILEAIRS